MKWKSELWKITKSEYRDMKDKSDNLLIITTRIIFIGICVFLDIILLPFYILASFKTDNYEESAFDEEDEYY